MTITDFLLARIAEDEAAAQQSEATWTSVPSTQRVLAECEAKRRIVEMHRPGGEHEPDACVLCQWDIDCEAPRASYQPGAGAFPCNTLRALASVYADHPDFRDEWRL